MKGVKEGKAAWSSKDQSRVRKEDHGNNKKNVKQVANKADEVEKFKDKKGAIG